MIGEAEIDQIENRLAYLMKHKRRGMTALPIDVNDIEFIISIIRELKRRINEQNSQV